jgi:hypothetical protein
MKKNTMKSVKQLKMMLTLLKNLSKTVNTDYLITVDDQADISFEGKLIGYAIKQEDDSKDYNYTLLKLYLTVGGNYVCTETESGDADTNCYARACNSIEEITEFFGFDKLAKDLYESAEIDTTRHID